MKLQVHWEKCVRHEGRIAARACTHVGIRRNVGNVGADSGLVRLVVRHIHARHVEAEVQGLVSGGQSGPVGRDGCGDVGVGEVWIVVDVQGREDVPLDAWVLGRALNEVGGQQGPGHALTDAGLEPDGHGWDRLIMSDSARYPPTRPCSR